MAYADKLRKRFFYLIKDKWNCRDTYDVNFKSLSKKSGVYFFAHFNYYNTEHDIVYVGSSSNLEARHHSHKIINKVLNISDGSFPVLYFLEMRKGFYDYEMKLIKKLQPIFNKQHRG